MEMTAFFQLINDNPICYFVAGLTLGYLLRAYKSELRSKKTSRYQTKKGDMSKRTIISTDSDEPSFDWAEAAVKTIASARAGHVALDQQGNEFH